MAAINRRESMRNTDTKKHKKVCIYSAVQTMTGARAAGHHVTSPANVCSRRTSTPLYIGMYFWPCILFLRFGISRRSLAAKSGQYKVDVEAALYPVPSLCPTQRGCYGLACYHGVAEFQISELWSLSFNSWQQPNFNYRTLRNSFQ